jgi:serine/threonine protein kinase
MLGKHGDQKAFSPEFMDLINCLLQVDPIHRPTVYEIISHDWCKGAVPSQQEVIMEFQQRHA